MSENKNLIILRGMHSIIDGYGPINWELCYNSLIDNYIKFIDSKKYDIYFQTYDSNKFDKLLDKYKPIKYIKYSEKDINKYKQTENIYNAVKLVDNIDKYESIFVTRFDILYKLPFNKWNIKKDCINIFFQQPNNTINDVCFLFYRKNIQDFLYNLELNKKSINLHKLKFKNIHFMNNEKYYSDTDYPEFFPKNNNPYYILHRKRRWGFKNRKHAYRTAKEQGWIK